MELDFDDYILFNKENLSKKLRMLPSVIYHYGNIDNDLTNKQHDIKFKIDALKSRKLTELRVKYNRIKKSVTESEIKDIVKNDSEISKLNNELNELNKLLRQSSLRMKVLESFREIIINYGHDVRLERKGTKT